MVEETIHRQGRGEMKYEVFQELNKYFNENVRLGNTTSLLYKKVCTKLQLVEGDYTATVHVEEKMWLNIDYNDSAVLSFNVAVYPVNIIWCNQGANRIFLFAPWCNWTWIDTVRLFYYYYS